MLPLVPVVPLFQFHTLRLSELSKVKQGNLVYRLPQHDLHILQRHDGHHLLVADRVLQMHLMKIVYIYLVGNLIFERPINNTIEVGWVRGNCAQLNYAVSERVFA